MKRLALVLLIVLLFAATAVWAALAGKGTDGKSYLSLDEDEVQALHALMASKDAEIKRLKDERKSECGLI